jgi:glycosyltransferase involved in cell wall biosynthesis
LKIAVVNRGAPENYPPTLNAISRWCADERVASVLVLAPNIEFSDWQYPNKAHRIVCNAKCLSVDAVMRLSAFAKLRRFLRFARMLLRVLKTERPEVVMLIDEGPVLAYRWIRWLLPKEYQPIIWYHNHDVVENPGRFNLTGQGVRTQAWLFPKLAAFTLPANERQRFFPMQSLRGIYAEIPNCPERAFYSRFFRSELQPGACVGDDFRIVFQGAIGPGHGLEALLELAHSGRFERRLILVLKGWAQPAYEVQIKRKVVELGLEAQFEWHGFGPYSEVPKLAASCHAGIAIHSGTDAMNTSLGRASNKIYEYAALGLPVLLFDSPHFRAHLGAQKWALFTDISQDSLLSCLQQILANYGELKSAAREDFLHTYNFGHFFDPVWEKVKLLNQLG